VQRAEKLIPADEDGLVTVQLASGAALRGRTVVIATGARWREMNVPGEREYRGRGVAYCPHCDGPLFKGKPVAVTGGGAPAGAAGPARAGARGTFRASANIAGAALLTARTATVLCSRGSVSPSSAAATRAWRRPSTSPVSSPT